MSFIEQEELRDNISACYTIFHAGLCKWVQYGYYIGQLYARNASSLDAVQVWSDWIPLKNTIKRL